ncbi:MAG: type II and III secretion system protein family protein [Alphaproteobacteria bacterium]|nr:type II and III secretion system protein family protein [Alphaproteobacteria bacterium]
MLTTPALAAVKTDAKDASATAHVSTSLDLNIDHAMTLTLPQPASSVLIANPEIADIQVISPTSVLLMGKRTGETTLIASNTDGIVLQKTVVVTQDLSDLRRELDAVIPGGAIKAHAVPNGIILTGEAHDAGTVEDARRIAARYIPKDGGDVINRIKVAGSNQIQIRVRFAEVSRSVDKTLGIDWETISSVSGFAFGVASGATVVGGSNILNATRPYNTTLAQSNDIITMSHSGHHFNINSMIDALAQDGLVTILAEPNLTAMSGETASFLAGGEFPIPIPQSQNQFTIEFHHYGISLSFTPTLVGSSRINLHVKPEVSQLSQNGAVVLNSITVPALTTRKAETTVEVESGQSFAIAGLLDNSQAQTVDKYPVLGDLPILGSLFRSSEFKNDQSELVIIITPYIVRPADNTQALSMPTDGYKPPSEEDRLLSRRHNASDPNARSMSGDPLVTPGTTAPTVAPKTDEAGRE